MIIDTLENAGQYEHVLAGLDLAFEFLRSDRATSAPKGRYDLDGDRVFALVQSYVTKPFDQGVWEAHLRYADVQFLVHGAERLGYAPLSAMHEVQPYDRSRDCALYEGEGVMMPFRAGMFAVFLPQDVHRPGIAEGAMQEVRKVVVKVRVDEVNG